jgi:hypothetical protein
VSTALRKGGDKACDADAQVIEALLAEGKEIINPLKKKGKDTRAYDK